MNENTINFLNNIDFENTDNVYHIIETLYEENKKYKKVIGKTVKYIESHKRKDEFLELNEWQTRDLLEILNEVK